MTTAGPGLVRARPSHPAVSACVSENRPDWVRMVMSQAVSIRNLGGSLAASPLRAYFVGGLEGPGREALEELGVEVVAVEPFPSPIPHANKLRMFEAHAERGEGTLLALDTDVVVVGDLSEEVNPDALRGITGGYSPLTEQQWGAWLEERGLPRRAGAYPMHRVGKAISVPYLDSGVLMVPHRFCGLLVELWAKNVLALVDAFDRGTDEEGGEEGLPADARFFTDQLALTCALLEGDIPVDPLPVGCNFRPGFANFATMGIGHVSAVRAVHYHKWGLRPDGFIKPSPWPPLNPDLDRINRLVAAKLGLPYTPFGDDGLGAFVRRAADRSTAAVRRTVADATRRSSERGQ